MVFDGRTDRSLTRSKSLPFSPVLNKEEQFKPKFTSKLKNRLSLERSSSLYCFPIQEDENIPNTDTMVKEKQTRLGRWKKGLSAAYHQKTTVPKKKLTASRSLPTPRSDWVGVLASI